MSTHSVSVIEISEIQQHPNADRLAIIHVSGWNCARMSYVRYFCFGRTSNDIR